MSGRELKRVPKGIDITCYGCGLQSAIIYWHKVLPDKGVIMQGWCKKCARRGLMRRNRSRNGEPGC